MTRSGFRFRKGLGLWAAALCATWFCAAPAGADVLLSSGPAPARVSVVSYRDIPFRTVVRQRYDFSCGSAALATLLRYHYDREVGEEQIFRAMYAAGDQDVQACGAMGREQIGRRRNPQGVADLHLLMQVLRTATG